MLHQKHDRAVCNNRHMYKSVMHDATSGLQSHVLQLTKDGRMFKS